VSVGGGWSRGGTENSAGYDPVARALKIVKG